MSIDNGPWSIWSEDRIVATNTRQVLYHKIHSPNTQARLRDRGWRPSETFDLVDWTGLEQASKSVTETRRVWVMKHKHGMCGTGQFMKHWKYLHKARCPRCGHHNETSLYVTTCKAPDAITAWEKLMQSVKKWLVKVKTKPSLRNLLLARLREWKARLPRLRLLYMT
jgi:hypothetical protein